MLNNYNEVKTTKILSKVPWEPYKAATSSSKGLKENKMVQHLNDTFDSVNKADLIRYKVSTDLELFNSCRPGSQFDDADLKFIQKNSANSFVDARFYPDDQFIKLADELRSKFFEANPSLSKSSSSVNKPVNVVGPMFDNKCVRSTAETKLSKLQMNKYEQKIEYLENQLKGTNRKN